MFPWECTTGAPDQKSSRCSTVCCDGRESGFVRVPSLQWPREIGFKLEPALRDVLQTIFPGSQQYSKAEAALDQHGLGTFEAIWSLYGGAYTNDTYLASNRLVKDTGVLCAADAAQLLQRAQQHDAKKGAGGDEMDQPQDLCQRFHNRLVELLGGDRVAPVLYISQADGSIWSPIQFLDNRSGGIKVYNKNGHLQPQQKGFYWCSACSSGCFPTHALPPVVKAEDECTALKRRSSGSESGGESSMKYNNVNRAKKIADMMVADTREPYQVSDCYSGLLSSREPAYWLTIGRQWWNHHSDSSQLSAQELVAPVCRAEIIAVAVRQRPQPNPSGPVQQQQRRQQPQRLSGWGPQSPPQQQQQGEGTTSDTTRTTHGRGSGMALVIATRSFITAAHYMSVATVAAISPSNRQLAGRGRGVMLGVSVINTPGGSTPAVANGQPTSKIYNESDLDSSAADGTSLWSPCCP
ncbi:hypothetical protein VOLCADRAFT_88730 [Volvox carteri f. nagariensis]|uniref:Uncharacterized protein n=1 Tax=Volvox carteri f. nagariensis TaxID=3068 RepID=D8TPT3_VOLCA|nr:uncharacterized protein VOLCADRAFT_88730 [Volvox carteri f. nagariensis]EFJ50286.1 hypothetical protein VOLCADRAFT_88730 [Volvox carteri f. nagariensis]|eukprot:XP_002948411.1 hypothetical protein VOLCADRAFT_88730 [Volvox carteri f. nagariensis]